MLRVIDAGLIFDLTKDTNWAEDEIIAAAMGVSPDDVEEFASRFPKLVFHVNMVMIHLVLLEQQMDVDHRHSTTYDC